MNRLNSAILRGIIAVAIGVVFIIWPDRINNTIITILGALLIVPIISTLVSSGKSKQPTPMYLLAGTGGAAILGLIMIIMPSAFVNLLALFFGILLIISGITQLLTVIANRKLGLGFPFYIIPSALIIVGAVTLANFQAMINALWIMVGALFVLYGANEIFNFMKFKSLQKKREEALDIDDAEIVE